MAKVVDYIGKTNRVRENIYVKWNKFVRVL